jgi:predicted nucleic acid-binding protein
MGSTSLIAPGERVLLDSAALIYYLGTHPGYAALARELVTRIVTGDISGVISTVAIPEVLSRVYRESQRNAQALHHRFVMMPNVDWPGVSMVVADRAARLRAQYNLSTPDAIHVATALQRGAGWLVTNDRKLRRVAAEGIRVWLFDDHLGDATAAAPSGS